MDKSRGFSCDRQAKEDFTASTLNYFSGNPSLSFFECDNDNNLVPFNSNSASTTSRMDVTIVYSGDNHCLSWRVELKERQHPSSTYTEVFINPEKVEEINRMKASGENCLWCELYTDDKIAIWNLNKIDLLSLPTVTKPIPRYTVYNSEKIMQTRYLLAASAATVYHRRRNDK